MADVDKKDPQYKQIFLERFRKKLQSDKTGMNDLESFVELPEGVAPSAASIGPIKRGSEPLPPWLKLKVPKGMTHRPRFNRIRRSMREKNLSTVCEEAKCPNIGDRRPPPLDPEEPEKVAAAVHEMGVDYIVMTMVDRDDLPDGGASHVCRCIHTIKEKNPALMLEALVGDFHGDLKLVEQLAVTPLSVYAHNIECVERITPRVRDRRASYKQSLQTLEHVTKSTNGKMLTKSSIMLGLGEEEKEVRQTLRDLRTAGVSAVTLGQYLQPSRTRLKVSRYAHPKEFEMWEKEAMDMGFLYCASGPMVRSSYRAGEYYIKSILKQRQSAEGGKATAAATAANAGAAIA
ncbi:hypothetical protein CGC20_9150 [Leishmania donovani]|uniref:Lipoyl synthase, mitochondrial n=1 Tax=Leishmania donovani TaxID=5661 RepID=A0A504X2G0_LEIDO|nr:hypothetical protein CGC20_9150 [Leishmania donovani]TPP51031.1 hypothetical protein CGC21_19410 [Leishmania donovani]